MFPRVAEAGNDRGRSEFRTIRSIKLLPILSLQRLPILRVTSELHWRFPDRGAENLKMKKIFYDFMVDESGATAIEYGLIAAGISLAIIAVVDGLGTKLNTKFTALNNSLK